MTKLSKKQRHQVKSRWYYIFWGAATVSVFAGQMYVGSGYPRMSEAIEEVLDSPIILDIGPPRRHPMMVPDWEDGSLYHPTDPPMQVSPEYEKDFRQRI